MRWLLGILIAASLFIQLGCGAEAEEEGDGMKIPKVNKIAIDGSGADWEKQGLSVTLHGSTKGETTDAFDFTPNLNFGWNKDGLAIFANVTDDVVHVNSLPAKLSNGDSIELIVSGKTDGSDSMKVILSAGADGKDEAVVRIEGRIGADSQRNEARVTAKSQKTGTGYTVEASIPFSLMHMDAKSGAALAMQIHTNDYDYGGDKNAISYPLYYTSKATESSPAMQVATLSEKTGKWYAPDIKSYKTKDSVFVYYYADEKHAGKEVAIRGGQEEWDRKPVAIRENAAIAQLQISLAKLGGSSTKLDVVVDGRLRQVIDVPSVETEDGKYPYENDIKAYEQRDKKALPPEGVTVFIGSSSIQRWSTLEKDMAPLQVINRGFGGSEAYQVTHFADRIVIPYKPKKIVFYEGDNDISKGTLPEQIVEECKAFVRKIHHALPGTKIYFVSIKPSPSRIKDWEKSKKTNQLLEEYAKQHEYLEFIDVSAAMIDEKGNPKADIFGPDRLHMNEKGYDIWTSIIRPRIEK
ncbi:GDSL-type esterase/lipase family protein [Paenibacillus allorhizosphaerae]|uniref:SGNH hydrolase-type esterase domain-containing protein n=1 Tax=Paenibacillus allorhizosphaerae TaxID=2849866 RepID=A0ABN7TZ49_9BACL|nr:GDSL-type esterase/lipase family protein [Paenibacillus allorhizosphaerae]CAG7657911.1 hypothetical protein PAECIP111802_06894 [Paenibacillus allorhizosphaerae]